MVANFQPAIQKYCNGRSLPQNYNLCILPVHECFPDLLSLWILDHHHVAADAADVAVAVDDVVDAACRQTRAATGADAGTAAVDDVVAGDGGVVVAVVVAAAS